MAWIEPRKGAKSTIYYVRWLENGHRRSARRRTRQEARALQGEIESQMAAGTYVAQDLRMMPFEEFALQVLAADMSLTDETRANYERTIRRQLASIANVPLEQVSGTVVRHLFLELEGRGLSDHTLQQAKKTISKVCSAAVEEGILKRNPARAVKVRKPPRRHVNPLSAQELHELAEMVPDRYRAPVMLAAWGGLRISEIGALDIGDFDFERGSVRISKSVKGNGQIKPPKSRAGNRTVTLPSWVLTTVREHHMATPPGHPLFGTRRGRRLNHLNVKAAGVKFHDLRHNHGAILIATGAHPKEIQERMGHSSITVTFDVYGHLLPDAPQKTAERLEQLAAQETGKVIEL